MALRAAILRAGRPRSVRLHWVHGGALGTAQPARRPACGAAGPGPRGGRGRSPGGPPGGPAAGPRGNPPVVGRLTMELLGPVPVAPLRVSASVVRPGRSVQLCEATVY